MYIDIFICIQIGPSQQNKHTQTIHMSDFYQRFSTQTEVSLLSANMWSVSVLNIWKSTLPGDKTVYHPPQTTRTQTRRRKWNSNEPQLKCFSNRNTEESFKLFFFLFGCARRSEVVFHSWHRRMTTYSDENKTVKECRSQEGTNRPTWTVVEPERVHWGGWTETITLIWVSQKMMLLLFFSAHSYRVLLLKSRKDRHVE